MPNNQEYASLAERCEGAMGPDREIDEAIIVALGGKRNAFRDWTIGHDYIGARIPGYTASLDAAMSLVPVKYWMISNQEGGPIATILVGDDEQSEFVECQAATPALALCAAALKARSLTVEDSRG